MLRTRHAAQVLAAAIIAWLVTTIVAYGWLLSQYLPDPSSHTAEDATLAMVVLSPQVPLALVGTLVLYWLWVGHHAAPILGLVWAVLESLVGFLLASRFLGLMASVVSEGRRVGWDAAEQAIVFSTAGGADFTHWYDWLAAALFVLAVLAAFAAAYLMATPGRWTPFGGHQAHA